MATGSHLKHGRPTTRSLYNRAQRLPEVMTAGDFAQLLGLSLSSFYRLTKRPGALPAMMGERGHNSRYIYLREHVLNWIDQSIAAPPILRAAKRSRPRR